MEYCCSSSTDLGSRRQDLLGEDQHHGAFRMTTQLFRSARWSSSMSLCGPLAYMLVDCKLSTPHMGTDSDLPGPSVSSCRNSCCYILIVWLTCFRIWSA